MRRNVILAAGLALGLVGCCNFRDLFSAHADVAAEAGGQQLPSAAARADPDSGGKGVKINRETADFVANVWVDYALFAQAVAEGKLPVDSASVAQAVWPEISELKGTHWHDTPDGAPRLACRRRGGRQPLQGARRPGAPAHPVRRAAQRRRRARRPRRKKKAEGALAQDPEGRQLRTARLASSRRIQAARPTAASCRRAPKGGSCRRSTARAGRSRPGQVSGLVETPFGYPHHQAARRWPRRASGSTTTSGAGGRAARLDLHGQPGDRPTRSRCCRARRRRCGRRRRPGRAPEVEQGAGRTSRAAQLTVKEYMRWVRALPPQYTAQLTQANDTHAHPVRPDPDPERAAAAPGRRGQDRDHAAGVGALKRHYEGQLDTLRAEMGLRTAT